MAAMRKPTRKWQKQQKPQPKTGDSSALAATNKDNWEKIDISNLGALDKSFPTKTVPFVGGENRHFPQEGISVRELKLGGGNLGRGLSMHIAENLGATPVGFTVNGKNVLSSKTFDAAESNESLEAKLGGAGYPLGGSPIALPHGRLSGKFEDGDFSKARIRYNRILLANFETTITQPRQLGPDGRIAQAPMSNDPDKKLASHGPVMTSKKWKLTAIETKGVDEENGIKVTYTLPLNVADQSDPVVDKLVIHKDELNPQGFCTNYEPGQITATYTLLPAEDGSVIFRSEVEVDPGKDNLFLTNSLGLHTFLEAGPEDKLLTKATKEYSAPEDLPELPTGEIIDIQEKHDFTDARKIAKEEAGPLELVLTGYKGTTSASLLKEDGSQVEVKTDAGNLLLCNKAPQRAA